jgi:hypothetical protein
LLLLEPQYGNTIYRLGVKRVQVGTKNLCLYFFGRYVGDLNLEIVHQNLLYDTMHKSLAFH